MLANVDFSAIFCPLCDEINCNESAYSKIFGIESHLLCSTQYFSLYKDICPIVSGHALLIPKSHYHSFAQLPKIFNEDFLLAKTFVDSLFRDIYKEFFIFEHGTSINGVDCGNCVSHAHIHYIPGKIDITKHMQPFSNKELKFSEKDKTIFFTNFNGEYLYYEDSKGDILSIENPFCTLPSQFIRQAMAKEIGIREWNWHFQLSNPTEE